MRMPRRSNECLASQRETERKENTLGETQFLTAIVVMPFDDIYNGAQAGMPGRDPKRT
jgi:hypothetical protein